jgi:hypothetical protein
MFAVLVVYIAVYSFACVGQMGTHFIGEDFVAQPLRFLHLGVVAREAGNQSVFNCGLGLSVEFQHCILLLV